MPSRTLSPKIGRVVPADASAFSSEVDRVRGKKMHQTKNWLVEGRPSGSYMDLHDADRNTVRLTP
jgi:hypothetical protein